MNPKEKAFKYQVESGKMKSDKEIVLNCIKEFPGLNILELVNITGIAEKTVSGRLSDLQDEGKIFISDGSGKYSKWQFQPDVSLQKLYARNRRMDKFISKKKALLKNYSDLMSEELNFQLS